MLRDYYVLQSEEIDDDYDCGGGYEDNNDYYDDSYDDYDYDEEKEEDMSYKRPEAPLLHASQLTYEPVRKKTLKEQLYEYFTYICEARLRFGFNGNFITAGGIELPLSSLIKTDNSLHPYGFKNFPGAHGSSLYSYYSNGMSFPRGGNEPGELDDWDIVDYKPTDKYHFSIGMPQYMSDSPGGFKTIADKCLGGELFGEFELLNGTKFYSYCLDKTQNYYRACDTDNGIGVKLFDEEGKCHNQYDEIPEEKVFKFTPHTFRWDGNNDGLFRSEDDNNNTHANNNAMNWKNYLINLGSEIVYQDLPITNEIKLASDFTVRNLTVKLQGFAQLKPNKIIDANGREMDTESFLSTLKVITKKEISEMMVHDAVTASFKELEEIPFRVLQQNDGFICNSNGDILIELDLTKPCKTKVQRLTIDGYIGVCISHISDMMFFGYWIPQHTDNVVKPKTWEDYCKNAKGEVYYYSPSTNQIAKIPVGKRGLVPGRNKWTLPTLELAEKMEAYFQLLSIHENWVQGWKPDWSKASVDKHCIEYDEGVPDRLIISKHQYVHHSLCFPTWDMANEFCKTFKDLLIKAQGLY